MIRRINVGTLWLAVAYVMAGGAQMAQATSVQLGITVNITTSSWTVTALASDAQQLGLASWSIDVEGSDDGHGDLISIGKALVASQTNQTPGNVFSQLRTTGTVNGANLTSIVASQDTADAIDDNDDSGQALGTALVYGYGFNGTAIGVYTSNSYGLPGPVTGLGPITLAKGTFTFVGNGFVGENITAVATPAKTFDFFPSDWDPDNSPTLGTTSLLAASAVIPGLAVIVVPEPASLSLLCLGGLGLAFFARRTTR